jgi:hypothetical protein
MHDSLDQITNLLPLYPKRERCQDNECNGDRKSPKDPELGRYLESRAVGGHAEEGRHGKNGLCRVVVESV